MKVALSFYLVSIPFLLQAQQFSVFSIPDSLRQNANVVTRDEEYVVEIKSQGNAVVHERHVYSVLNEAGKSFGKYVSFYDKFTSIENISGTLYNAAGKELKHTHEREMQDMSGTPEEDLISDTRYKINDYYCREYPYTVDYQEDDKVASLLELPDWRPQYNLHLSVELSRFIVIVPRNYLLRYKLLNGAPQPRITETDAKRTFTWELRDLPAISDEWVAPPLNRTRPWVMIAPSEFEASGYKGDMSTWADYGKFYFELLKGRDVLPDQTKKKVHDLTDNITDARQKVRLLYQYLQNNTRYISIQLGIGGLQPFDANFVATKNYGDCKALANFMVALLKEAGIRGNSVIIKSGDYNDLVDSSFSCHQFDHVICCVPFSADTMWLECTAAYLPAGYLSGFTANRFGLLVDSAGGKLVHTPKYGLSENTQVRKVRAIIGPDGNLQASVTTVYKAIFQDDLEGMVATMSKEELLESKKNSIDLPTYDVSDLQYKVEQQPIPPRIEESFDLKANAYAQASGKRLFICPDVLTRSKVKLETEEGRKYDIYLRTENVEVDSVEITIPTGYQPEAMPRDLTLNTQFGKFTSSTRLTSDKIVFTRRFERKSGQFPAEDYGKLVDFYEQIYKADHSNVVMVKNAN